MCSVGARSQGHLITIPWLVEGGETPEKGLSLGVEQALSCMGQIMVMCLARQRTFHATLKLEIIVFLLNQGFLGAFQ